MQVLVASRNPVKVGAVEQAFRRAFPSAPLQLQGLAAPSGVRDQPMTDEETLLGARNRMGFIKAQRPEADFWVAIEGGVRPTAAGMEAFGWMAVQHRQRESCTRSATFQLPSAAVRALRSGEELGPVMDRLVDETGTKAKGGAVGLLSNGLVTRTSLYVQPLLLALIPFLQEELYP